MAKTKIKLLIAGSRSLNDYRLIERALNFAKISVEDIEEVVHGGAKGIDSLAGKWAQNHCIKVRVFEAEWKNLDAKGAIIKENAYGKYNVRAGYSRNEKMAEYSDVLVAIWNGSKGTEHMINCMKDAKKPFTVFEV